MLGGGLIAEAGDGAGGEDCGGDDVVAIDSIYQNQLMVHYEYL